MYHSSFKNFLEMDPKQGVINASLLTKFRKLRLTDSYLLNLQIGKTVEIAIDNGIVRSRSIIVDATYSLSRIKSIFSSSGIKRAFKTTAQSNL